MSNNNNRKQRIGKMIGEDLNLDPNHYKNDVVSKVTSEPKVTIPGVVSEVKKTTSHNNNDKAAQNAEKDFYDPNYKGQRDKQNGNNKNKYKNFRDPKVSNEEEKMDIKSKLGSPLSLVFANNSVSIIKEFKELLKERMPEFAKCVGSVELAPYDYEVRDAANMPKKITSAKLVLKCRFGGSKYSKARGTNEQEFGDPLFAALANKANGRTNNKGELPGDLKDIGKGILFDDGIDIIKYEVFVDKDGRPWADLVALEISLDAAIPALTGMPSNEYTGYVSDIVRAKELEQKLIIEQRRQGLKVGNMSAIYIVRMTLDNNKVLSETMKYFKKYKNDGKNNNRQNSYRNAEDQFFSK